MRPSGCNLRSGCLMRFEEQPEASRAIDTGESKSKSSDRRRAPRARIVSELIIIPSQVCAGDLWVTEISQTGCRLFLKHHSLVPEQHISLKFAHLEFISGRVAWTMENSVGVVFHHKLHIAVLDFIARTHSRTQIQAVP